MSEEKLQEPQSLDDLKAHPLFKLLTTKQQQFVLVYIELGGDRVAAVKRVYGENKGEPLAMRCIRTAHIRKLIAFYYGYEVDQASMGKPELAMLISARLRRPETNDSTFVRLAECFLELISRKRNLKKTGRPRKEESEDVLEQGEPEIDDMVRLIEAKNQGKGK